jgi:hypothetical protein
MPFLPEFFGVDILTPAVIANTSGHRPRQFSIVIAREGGRSSTPRAASSGTASLRPTFL